MLNSFLSRCASAAAAAAASGSKLDVVLGNEGGDMDSVVGGIYMAYFLTVHNNRGDDGVPFIPLLNFPKVDLPLRNDVVQLLSSEGVDAGLLLSATLDVDLNARTSSISLFDHNKLTSHQAHLMPCVTRVVDHHADEGMYRTQCDPSTYTIAEVGSASTLVEELYFNNGVPIPQPLILLAPIVLDTMNFDPVHKKTTPRDEASRDRLMASVPQFDGEGMAKLREWFDLLNCWKNDVSTLTIPETLRRDYKRFSLPAAQQRLLEVGISSVLMLATEVDRLYGESTWIAGCESFRLEHGLDALLVMFAGTRDGVFTRELGVMCPGDLIDAFKGFCATTASEVGLALMREEELASGLHYVVFAQATASVSRKKLTPLLGRFLNSSL